MPPSSSTLLGRRRRSLLQFIIGCLIIGYSSTTLAATYSREGAYPPAPPSGSYYMPPPRQQYGGYPPPPPPPPPYAAYGGIPQLPPPTCDTKAAEFMEELGTKDARELAGRCIAPLLETVVDTNDRLQLAGAQPPPKASIFRVKRTPTVTIKAYLDRMVRLTGCTAQCLITALVYLDRIATKEYPSNLTIHRLLLASLMLAAKHTDSGGKGWNYNLYTKVSGIPESELKVLEVEMLKALQYDLVVMPKELYDYGTKAIKFHRHVMFRPENP